MRRGLAVLAGLVSIAGVMAAPARAAEGPYPSVCRDGSVRLALPGVARSHALSAPDFADTWRFSVSPRNFANATARESIGLLAFSDLYGSRRGVAPDWQLDQRLYRYQDLSAASAGYAVSVARRACESFPDEASTVEERTSPSGDVQSSVRRLTRLPASSVTTPSTFPVWTAVIRVGTMVGVYRLSSPGPITALTQASRAVDTLELTAQMRLASTVPPTQGVAFPVDTTRRPPPVRMMLLAGEIAAGWRRVDGGVGFSGGVDDGALGGSAACQPVDYLIVASRGYSYSPPKARPTAERSYESVFTLRPGQGPAFVSHVRTLLRTDCSRYRLLPDSIVASDADEALVLGPRLKYKGGRGLILVREGDTVGFFGFDGVSEKSFSTKQRRELAVRMAARLS